jgi:protein TonB
MRKLRYFAALVLTYSLLGVSLAQAAGRRVVKRVPPRYPELAIKMKVEGTVRLEADVNADGKVEEVRALSGHALLKPAAIDCLKKWEFEPGRGKTTEVVFVNFKLSE